MLKEKPECLSKISSLSKEKLVTTEINRFEILFGVFKRKGYSQTELDLVNDFFDNLDALPLDSPSTYKAAEISGKLSQQGSIIELSDVLIAGICIVNNCKILTKDTKHFSRIKDLKVETY